MTNGVESCLACEELRHLARPTIMSPKVRDLPAAKTCDCETVGLLELGYRGKKPAKAVASEGGVVRDPSPKMARVANQIRRYRWHLAPRHGLVGSDSRGWRDRWARLQLSHSPTKSSQLRTPPLQPRQQGVGGQTNAIIRGAGAGGLGGVRAKLKA